MQSIIIIFIKKGLLQECEEEGKLEAIGATTTSCLKRRL